MLFKGLHKPTLQIDLRPVCSKNPDKTLRGPSHPEFGHKAVVWMCVCISESDKHFPLLHLIDKVCNFSFLHPIPLRRFFLVFFFLLAWPWDGRGRRAKPSKWSLVNEVNWDRAHWHAWADRSYKVTTRINHSVRDGAFDGIHDLLRSSSG